MLGISELSQNEVLEMKTQPSSATLVHSVFQAIPGPSSMPSRKQKPDIKGEDPFSFSFSFFLFCAYLVQQAYVPCCGQGNKPFNGKAGRRCQLQAILKVAHLWTDSQPPSSAQTRATAQTRARAQTWPAQTRTKGETRPARPAPPEKTLAPPVQVQSAQTPRRTARGHATFGHVDLDLALILISPQGTSYPSQRRPRKSTSQWLDSRADR